MLNISRSMILLWIMLFHFQSHAQSDSMMVSSDLDTTRITIIEEMPQFPGGEKELFKFISKNITYPDLAIRHGIQGAVYVTFVIEKDGSIIDAKVLRGIGGGCDEEALRVVNAMPAWSPGKQGGKAVRTQFNLPIRFTLTGAGKSRKKSRGNKN